MEGVSYPHDNALVITLKVATGKVARTLVDTGNSVDIIFKSALDQLLIKSPRITPCNTPLIGFTGDMVIPKGIITLPVTIGEVPHWVVHMIDFLIVDHPGAYNIILGRPFLATTKAAISMHYLSHKDANRQGNYHNQKGSAISSRVLLRPLEDELSNCHQYIPKGVPRQ